jgi:hypothetical protein
MAGPHSEPPVGRWGRLAAPDESRGAYLFLEVEDAHGRWKPPPEGAIRLWHRRSDASPEDDLNNWTVWFPRSDLETWMAKYVVEEWLPEGVEPSWDS